MHSVQKFILIYFQHFFICLHIFCFVLYNFCATLFKSHSLKQALGRRIFYSFIDECSKCVTGHLSTVPNLCATFFPPNLPHHFFIPLRPPSLPSSPCPSLKLATVLCTVRPGETKTSRVALQLKQFFPLSGQIRHRTQTDVTGGACV